MRTYIVFKEETINMAYEELETRFKELRKAKAKYESSGLLTRLWMRLTCKWDLRAAIEMDNCVLEMRFLLNNFEKEIVLGK